MTDINTIPHGTFTEDARPVDRPCRMCKEHKVTMQVWESSDGAYDDEKYTCGGCGYYWWVEGPDS